MPSFFIEFTLEKHTISPYRFTSQTFEIHTTMFTCYANDLISKVFQSFDVSELAAAVAVSCWR